MTAEPLWRFYLRNFGEWVGNLFICPINGWNFAFPFTVTKALAYDLPTEVASVYSPFYTYDPKMFASIIYAGVFVGMHVMRTLGGLKMDDPRGTIEYMETQMAGIYEPKAHYIMTGLNIVLFQNETYCSNTDGKYYLFHPGLGTDIVTAILLVLAGKYGFGKIVKFLGQQYKRIINKRKHQAIIGGQDEIIDLVDGALETMYHRITELVETKFDDIINRIGFRFGAQ